MFKKKKKKQDKRVAKGLLGAVAVGLAATGVGAAILNKREKETEDEVEDKVEDKE